MKTLKQCKLFSTKWLGIKEICKFHFLCFNLKLWTAAVLKFFWHFYGQNDTLLVNT